MLHLIVDGILTLSEIRRSRQRDRETIARLRSELDQTRQYLLKLADDAADEEDSPARWLAPIEAPPAIPPELSPTPPAWVQRVANLKAVVAKLLVAMKSSDHGYMSHADQMIIRTAEAVMEDAVNGLG